MIKKLFFTVGVLGIMFLVWLVVNGVEVALK